MKALLRMGDVMIKAAVFDIDGTLIDSLDGWRAAVAAYLEKINKPFDLKVYNEMHKLTADRATEYLKREMKLEASAEEIRSALFSQLYDFYKNRVRAFDGVPYLLGLLTENGVKLAAATSNNRIFAEAGLCRTGLMKYFSFISTCDELGTVKSEPYIFEYTAEKLGASPRDTAVFEDSEHAVETARRAGFRAVDIKALDLSDKEKTRKFVFDL